MIAKEVTQIIKNELSQAEDIRFGHDLDLSKCLVVPPRMEKFENSFQGPKFIKLWLVLEEEPETHSGYKIIFDENTKQFGLAAEGEESPVLIGYYGSFIDTLEGM